jgi:hypothetical protein
MLRKNNNTGYVNRIDGKTIAIEPFKGQDYWKIKNDCLKNKILFEDPLFAANESSLFLNRQLTGGIAWKRPQEIIDWRQYPIFIYDKIATRDFNEGFFGKRWFVNGCIVISIIPELFSCIVPYDQVCSGIGYAGIFHFRFWVSGKWYDVVIDDRLPVYENDNRLVFCSNKRDSSEMWAPLLEKAYAKLHICYENLHESHLRGKIQPLKLNSRRA